MSKHMIRVPDMIRQIDAAKFRPNVFIIFLIGIAIYFAYFIASLFGGVIFGIALFAGSSFDSISDMISGLFTSPSVILFSLYYTAVLIVLTIVYVRFIGKRQLSTIGLSAKRLPMWYATGFAWGTGALLLTLLPSILSEGITFIGFTPLVALYLLAFMIQSASEEVFFRGYLMSSLANRIGIVWAVVISSALFSLLHIFNGDYSLLGGISIMLIGALLALYTLRTNSLWGACGFHAAWNFISGLLDRFDIGGFSVDYAAFNIGGTQTDAANQGFVGDPYNIYYIAVFLLAIALVLFAGKNKLVVKRPVPAIADDSAGVFIDDPANNNTNIKYYVVDVFTDHLFGGNPAGVCLLGAWPQDAALQRIAMENNLAETAFLVRRDGYYDLRWFTPEVEMDLCGHATLASAFVLMTETDTAMKQVSFHTQSGLLTVSKSGDIYTMDFPSRRPVPCPIPERLEAALGVRVLETHMSRDLLVLVEDEPAVRHLHPDFSLLKQIDQAFAVIVTAKGDDCDFVSRFFAPNAGIIEDPVTGSSHCTLIPFWSVRLGKTQMVARQLSARGGILLCEDCGERVRIGGKAIRYLKGEISL